MATWYFTVHGGDFREGKGSYSEGLFSSTFHLPGFAWRSKRAEDVEAVELVTDEMLKDGPSRAGAGAVGFLLLGPIGAALGVLVVPISSKTAFSAQVSGANRYAAS
jgi:hypothetical protein